MRTLLILASLLVASSAFAEPATSPENPAVVAFVTANLLEPLAKREHDQSKFSRARLPPSERRVRVLDAAPHRDATGATFVRFAIEERHGLIDQPEGEGWSASITGCAYLARKKIFVERGESYRPGAFLLGKHRPAAPKTTSVDASATVAAR
jgi:hypothetical protein